MNPLFERCEDVQSGVPVWSGARLPLTGWRPPPSPWIEESVPIEPNVVNIGEATVHVPTSGATVAQFFQGNMADCPLPSPPVSDDVAPSEATVLASEPIITEQTQQNEFDGAPQYMPSKFPHIRSFITVTEETTVIMPELPCPPVQTVLIQGNPPEIKDLPHPETELEIDPSFSEDGPSPWRAFLDLRKNTEESVTRMKCFYDQVMKLQLSHEQEAASYRTTAEGIINHQRKQLDSLVSDYKDALSKNESLTGLLEQKNLELMRYQRINCDINIHLKDAEQRRAHVEDRALIAENGRSFLELRVGEMEMLLEHATQVTSGLRERLKSYDKDRERIIQEHCEAYEANRKEVISFYNEREKLMILDFNDSVKKLQEAMKDTIKVREERLSNTWSNMICGYEKQHDSIVRELGFLRENEESEFQAKIVRIEQEKERWYDQYRKEMDLLEQRHQEREQHLLADIERRERELGEREQKMRLLRLQEEQEAKVALLSKESELKAYYQRITEDMRASFAEERDKLSASFRDKVQELSQLHLNNERELERLHREKEREMAQRYRIAGYEVDDRKGDLDLRGVSLQTQSSLLSKLDAIETRQRERAEKTRAVFQNSTQ